ncbi:MAG: nuclear transport factor 2 family protein [Ilumatobacteraceae bacterium]
MTNDLRDLEDCAVIMEQMHRLPGRSTGSNWTIFVTSWRRDVVMAFAPQRRPHGHRRRARLDDQEYSPFEATHHLISNISVTFTGAGSAEAVSYVSAWHRYVEGEHPDVLFWGEYHDTWTLVEGAAHRIRSHPRSRCRTSPVRRGTRTGVALAVEERRPHVEPGTTREYVRAHCRPHAESGADGSATMRRYAPGMPGGSRSVRSRSGAARALDGRLRRPR